MPLGSVRPRHTSPRRLASGAWLTYTTDFAELCTSLADRPDIDLRKLRSAHQIACDVHQGQTRCSGESYITHPVAVASLAAFIGSGQVLLCAALLHDTLEEAQEPDRVRQRIKRVCGADVLRLVEAMTKDRGIADGADRQEKFQATFETKADQDYRLAVLKLVDLLHNLITIDGLPEARRKQWLYELETQYLPATLRLFTTVPQSKRDLYLLLCNHLLKLLSPLPHA